MFNSPSKLYITCTGNVLGNKGVQPTQLVDPILAYCWSSVADGGPALGQFWVNNVESAFKLV